MIAGFQPVFAGSRDREFPNSLKNTGLEKVRLPSYAAGAEYK
jgi:hypothetical protein